MAFDLTLLQAKLVLKTSCVSRRPAFVLLSCCLLESQGCAKAPARFFGGSCYSPVGGVIYFQFENSFVAFVRVLAPVGV